MPENTERRVQIVHVSQNAVMLEFQNGLQLCVSVVAQIVPFTNNEERVQKLSLEFHDRNSDYVKKEIIVDLDALNAACMAISPEKAKRQTLASELPVEAFMAI